MIEISGKYLLLPINEKAKLKRIQLEFDNGKSISLLSHLDEKNPVQVLKYPLFPIGATKIRISIEPKMDFTPVFTDDDAFPISFYRPRLHFTSPFGWINDPNGLIFHDGKYHLFYQHNPADTCWNNMHWGHAVSSDLFHWQHLEEALFPDEFGTMWSGSALHKQGKDGFYVFYTVAGDPFCQHIAYTKDGLRLQKQGEILPHIVETNRDPKVVRDKKREQFVMSL